MALNALIARAVKERVTANAQLSALLPGDLHYGKRADTSATRPFAAMTVDEFEREYDSGGGAIVRYRLTVTVYGGQRARNVGEILQVFSALLSREVGWLQVVADQLGSVLSIVPSESDLTEDETEEFGKDVMVGRSAWRIVVNEHESIEV